MFFNIYTEFCLLSQALLMLCGLNSLTLSHWRGWLKPVPSQKVTWAWGPLCGECQEFSWHLYSGWNGHPKNWCMDKPTHFTTPYVVSLLSLEWREVELRRSWSVMSFKPHWYDQFLNLWNTDVDVHTSLVPVHWTFHPWSSKEALENFQMNAQSFLFTHPSGLLPVCCWASDGQFTLCGTSSVSLSSRYCSSRVVVVHLACIAHTTIQRGVPSVGAIRKGQFWWRTHECPVLWFLMRQEGMPSATWYSTSYGSSSHGSFTFFHPLQVSALAKTKSPGSSEIALAFLSEYHFCLSASDMDCTWASLKAFHSCSHNLAM